MAFIISVPPPPERVSRKSCAFLRFSGVAGTGSGKSILRVTRKGDQVESVGRIEIVQRELHSLFRFLDREAIHRAGGVQHKHQFLWRHVFDGDSLRWLQNQSKEPAFRGAMRQQRIGNTLSGHVKLHHEILVGNYRAVLESNARAGRARTLRRQCRVILNGGCRLEYAGVEGDVQRNIVTDAHAFRYGLRRNARSVRNLSVSGEKPLPLGTPMAEPGL